MKELVDLIKRSAGDSTSQQIHLLLVFDSAHILRDGVEWSWYDQLRIALGAIRDIDVFTVFLSVRGKVEALSPARMNNSEWIYRGPIEFHRPFCGLGFDQFARVVWNEKISLDDVTKLEILVMMGRPL